jgi:hypothetical protein
MLMPWTRRGVLEVLALVPVASACPTALRPATASHDRCARPVLTFHLDQPYLDPTGTAAAYVPPRGARGAAYAAALDAQALLLLFCRA